MAAAGMSSSKVLDHPLSAEELQILAETVEMALLLEEEEWMEVER